MAAGGVICFAALTVTPAKAGVQCKCLLDTGLRRYDAGVTHWPTTIEMRIRP